MADADFGDGSVPAGGNIGDSFSIFGAIRRLRLNTSRRVEYAGSARRVHGTIYRRGAQASRVRPRVRSAPRTGRRPRPAGGSGPVAALRRVRPQPSLPSLGPRDHAKPRLRSEERRVGKAWRSRWSTD